MKKILSLIFIAFVLNTLLVNSYSDLEEISSTLTQLEAIHTKIKSSIPSGPKPSNGKKEIAKIDEKFYQDLDAILSSSNFHTIQEHLETLTKRAATFVAQDIIQVLRNQSLGIIGDDLSLHYKDLTLKLHKFEFVSYVMLICGIIETIITKHNPNEDLSIFCDDILSSPLLIYLLIFSLQGRGYKKIDINVLSNKDIDFTNLTEVLKSEFPECKAHRYKAIKDFIKSDNKIDLYISNFTFPTKSDVWNCEKTILSGKTKIKATWQIIIEDSLKQNLTYIFSKKNSLNKKVRDNYFNYLLNQILSTTKIPKKCYKTNDNHANLADIIDATNKSGKKVPLFLCSFKIKDTRASILSNNIAIKAQLNFDNYSELLSGIFKTYIGLLRKDFSDQAKLYELFVYDKNDHTKYTLLNNNLDDTPSVITTFFRRKKIIAPSETIIT